MAPSTHQLLCGDFNINVLRKSKRLSELINILNRNDLFLQNGNQATRETKTSKTCIDLFFSNVKKPLTIFKTSVTDHYGVILNTTSQTCKKEPFITKTRPWYKLESESFLKELNESLYENLLEVETKISQFNCDELFLLLNEKLRNNIESFLPEKTSNRKSSKHWVDNELKNAASKKHRFRKLFLKTGTTEARSKFESQSKVVRKLLSQKKKAFYQNKLRLESNNNSREFFRLYNDLICATKNNDQEEKNINVDEFNDFFANIGKKLARNFKTLKN